jgi:hypothetical protein
VAVSIGTMITAPMGAALAHKMNPKPLKRAFALFITVVALNMLRKAMGYSGGIKNPRCPPAAPIAHLCAAQFAARGRAIGP